MEKMKRKLFFNILLLCSLGTLFSCKKLLEQEPKNSTYGDAFWSDPRAGANAVAGNYALLRDALSTGIYNTWNRYYMYGDAAADIEYAMRSNDGQGNAEVHSGRFESNYTVLALGDWSGYLRTVAMANIVYKKMSEVPDELLNYHQDPITYRNNVLGQALFIRALTYFMMVRIWGDVPLVTEAYEDPITAPQLGRTPKLEVMAQIEKDCEAALALLGWSYPSSSDRAVTANKGSVYALLAHLYLWRATVTNVQNDAPIMADVDKAADAIAQIEANGGYALTDTNRYYQTFIGRSTESIFEINKSEDTQEGSSQHIGRWFLNNTNVPYFTSTPYYYVKPSYLTSHFYEIKTVWQWVWENNAWVWKGVASKVLDTTDLRFRRNFQFTNTNYPTSIKYSNVIYRNPGQQRDGYFSNNMNIFRLSDMLLLKAEIALYRNQVPAAIEIINGFRKRNGGSALGFVPDNATKATVMSEYIIERAKELFVEGHLYYDLVRTRKALDLVPYLNADRFRQEGFYWPVSPQLFSNNRFLVQTQYWRGKI